MQESILAHGCSNCRLNFSQCLCLFVLTFNGLIITKKCTSGKKTVKAILQNKYYYTCLDIN